MNGNILLIIIALISLAAGGIITYLFHLMILRKRSTNIIKEAEAESEVIRKDKILQAKEKFFQLKSEHEKFINERNNKLNASENRFNQKESILSQRIEENERAKKETEIIRNNLNAQMSLLDKKNEKQNFNDHCPSAVNGASCRPDHRPQPGSHHRNRNPCRIDGPSRILLSSQSVSGLKVQRSEVQRLEYKLGRVRPSRSQRPETLCLSTLNPEPLNP